MNILLSIIIPCLNEEDHIEKLLNWVVTACPDESEILVIDGGSSDRTIELINNKIAINKKIKLLHNNSKYVSHALNTGVQSANGKYIARLDVHAIYPDNYFTECIKLLETTQADNVGGFLEYTGNNLVSHGIAATLSSPWGIGYRTISPIRFNHYTDTVFFGFWNKSAFTRFGLFDTDLIRDQDEEFNYRIIKSGGKIYKCADIVILKFVRNNLILLFRQYLEYGFYKPLVIKKIGHIIKIRHIVPSAFVVYLLTLFFFSVNITLLIPVWLYLTISLYFAINQNNPLSSKIISFIAFPVIHIAYGSGFLAGIFRTLR
ncbi:MAG: glycosyltransferase family 2 protein [Bacteroidia bacterium]|nr:glycosyltransferase family 2 protein [Bacteroidia bacterium]